MAVGSSHPKFGPQSEESCGDQASIGNSFCNTNVTVNIPHFALVLGFVELGHRQITLDL